MVFLYIVRHFANQALLRWARFENYQTRQYCLPAVPDLKKADSSPYQQRAVLWSPLREHKICCAIPAGGAGTALF